MAITLINAKLCMNIVVGSALSLVTERKKIQCTHRGRYINALHFHCHFGDSGGTLNLGESIRSLSAFLVH